MYFNLFPFSFLFHIFIGYFKLQVSRYHVVLPPVYQTITYFENILGLCVGLTI